MSSSARGASAPDTGVPRAASAGSPWAALLAPLLLLAAWRVFFAFYDAHTALGPSVVPPVGAGRPTASAWAESGPWFLGPGVTVGSAPDGAPLFRLASSGGVRATAGFPIRSWPAQVAAFRVSARVRCEDVRRGEEAYHVARIILFHRDAAGEPHFEWPHTAVALAGTKPWRRAEFTFAIPPFSRGAELQIAQLGTQGTMEVAGLAVTPMRVTRGHGWVAAGGGAVWGLAALACAWRLRLHRRRRGPWVIAASLAIAAGMLLPERTLEWTETTVASGLAQAVGAASPPPVESPPPSNAAVAASAPDTAGSVRPRRGTGWRPGPGFARDLRQRIDVHKPGHVVAFALLGLAAAACFIAVPGARRDGRRWAAVIGGLLVYAYAAEQLQWLTLTRHAKLADVGSNVAGLALGLMLAAVMLRRHRRGPVR